MRRTPDGLLCAFRTKATPTAFQLAGHLAATPLTLPVMQLAQRGDRTWQLQELRG